MNKGTFQQVPSFVVKGAVDLSRLMKKPLGIKVAGIEPRADLYVHNGYRYVSVSASTDDKTLELASQRFRNMARLGDGAIHKLSIQIGYESQLPMDNPAESVKRLKEPHHRILSGLFWPHLDDAAFEVIVRHRSLVAEDVLSTLQEISASKDRRRQILGRHALAIVYHNLALAEEISIIKSGQGSGVSRMWEKALEQWALTLNSADFWGYLNELAGQWGDHRFGSKDIDSEFKTKISAVILAFHAFFVRSYARLGRREMYLAHLDLIRRSKLPEAAKKEILISVAKSVAVEQLKPLVSRALNPEGAEYMVNPDENKKSVLKKQFPASGSVSWSVFAGVYDPLIQEAMSIRDFLEKELQLPEGAISQAEFDTVCETILDATDKRIDFKNERERALLYLLVLSKKMLQLPLSNATKQRIRELIRSRTQWLYGEFELPGDLESDSCWFLPGEPADPACSILLPVYKITYEDIVSHQWSKLKILVPRCRLAARSHEGKLKPSDLLQARQTPQAFAIREQIQTIEDQARREQQHLEESLAQRISQIQSEQDRRLTELSRSASDQEKKDRSLVKQAEAQVAQKQRAHQERLKTERTNLEKTYGPRIEAGRRQQKKVQETCTGFSAVLGTDVPMGGAGLLILGAVGFLAAGLTVMNPATCGIILGVLGAAAGGLAGRHVRRLKIRMAGDPARAVEVEMKSKYDALKRQLDQELSAVRKEADRQTADARKRLKNFDQKLGEIETQGKQKTEAARQETETKVSEIQTAAKKKTERLEQSLRVTIDPISKKQNFPIYTKAKANGYRDGEDPPSNYGDGKVQRFVSQLPYDQQQRIVLLARTLSNDQFAELLRKLEKMSSYERGRFLNGFGLF